MSAIGLGYYGRGVSIVDGLDAYLVHNRPGAAAQLRTRNPWAIIVGRADSGDDGTQVAWPADYLRAPDGHLWTDAELRALGRAAADRFVDGRLAPMITLAGQGTLSLVLGPNENIPGRPKAGASADDLRRYRNALVFRAALEERIAERVQDGVEMPAGWKSVPYACLSANTGTIDAEDLPIFEAAFRRSFAINLHGYLKEGVTRVEDEREPYHLWRSLDIWLPWFKSKGIPMRLVVGECGPFVPMADRAAMARLMVAIAAAFIARAKERGVTVFAVLGYGAGLFEGAQGAWELESQVEIFAAACAQDGPPTAADAVLPAPIPAANPEGVKKVNDYLSPNHGGARTETRGIVVHSTRGGSGNLEDELGGTMVWHNNPASEDSCHAVVSPTRTGRPVRDDLIAWHCRERNKTHLGIELCQARLGDPIPEAELMRGAEVCAEWCIKYGIPVRWDLERGFVEHRYTPEGARDGKTDVGSPFDGNHFLDLVRAAIARRTQPAAPALNWSEVALYPTWALARIGNHEEPRDLSAFVAHLKALSCDSSQPRRYGWPAA